MIPISVNNKEQQCSANTTLKEILVQLHINTEGIAVAINDSVVPKKEWASTTFVAKDQILIIQATQGG